MIRRQIGGMKAPPPSRFRALALPLAGGLIFALAIGWWAYQWVGTRLTPGMASHGAPAPIQVGGPFTLVDGDGRTVRDSDFRGRFMLIYFGYTFCPDVCPTSLQTMADALARLDAGQVGQIQPIFISVDPERDTAKVLKDYPAAFDTRIIGLSGSPEAVAQAARGFRVFYRRSAPARAEPNDPHYTIDHTAMTYLMGRDGRYVSHFAHDATPEQMADGLRRALAAN